MNNHATNSRDRAHRHRGAGAPRRGAALIFALIVTLVVSVLLFGIGTVCVSHFALANRHQDSAAAINAADSALAWEVNKMGRQEDDAGIAIDNTQSNAFSGALPGIAGGSSVSGTVGVYIAQDQSAKNVPWQPRSAFYIRGSGTVNGVTRTVEASGYPVALGDLYPVYGIHSLTLTGSYAIITGFTGTAGTMTAGLTTGLRGTLLIDRFDGVQGGWSGPVPAWDWLYTKMDSVYPTVQQIANRLIPRYIAITGKPLMYLAGTTYADFWKANADNNTWIKAKYKDGALKTVKWPTSNHTRIDHALWTTNNTDAKNPLVSIVLAGNPQVLSNGFRVGSDFYIEHLDMGGPASSNDVLEIYNGDVGSTGYGAVRVWFGPSGRDPVAGNVFDLHYGTITIYNRQGAGGRPDPSAFVIYNGSATPARLGGTTWQDAPPNGTSVSRFTYALIYCANADALGGYGRVIIDGDWHMNGCVIGWDLAHTALLLQASPWQGPAPGIDPLKYILFYRLSPQGGTGWVDTDAMRAYGAAQ